MTLSRVCVLFSSLVAGGCVQSHRATPVVVYTYTPKAVAVAAPATPPPPTVVYEPTPTSERPDARVYLAPPSPPRVAGSDVDVAQSISHVPKDDPDMAAGSENVLVTVDHGVVVLRGTVPAEHYKDEISLRVKKLPGVERVEDRIGVEGER